MLVKGATLRECEYFFRKKLERKPNRYEDYVRKYRRIPRAAISLVSSASSHPANTPGTVSSAGSVAAGDLIIVGVNWGNFQGSYSVKDGLNNVYNQFPNVTNSVGISGMNDINAFWLVNPTTQNPLSITVTVTGGGSHGLRLGMFQYNSSTGWPANPVDQGNSHNNAATGLTGNPGNITPSVAGTLAWAAIQMVTSGATAITVDSPYIEQPSSGGTAGTGWTSDARADSGDNQNATTSLQTCTFRWLTISTGYSSLIANFIPSVQVSNPVFEEDSFGIIGSSVDTNVSKW